MKLALCSPRTYYCDQKRFGDNSPRLMAMNKLLWVLPHPLRLAFASLGQERIGLSIAFYPKIQYTE
jgi:hypothetical protein